MVAPERRYTGTGTVPALVSRQRSRLRPAIPPYPLPKQTSWTFGVAETRNPLELLKAAACVARAEKESVPSPASSEACSTAFPDLVSGGEQVFIDALFPSKEVVGEQREGCTLIPIESALVCSWEFSEKDPHHPEHDVTYALRIPFGPGFSTLITECGAGKDHWVGEYAFGRAGGNSLVVKGQAILPTGCMGWDGLVEHFEYQGFSFQSDMPR